MSNLKSNSTASKIIGSIYGKLIGVTLGIPYENWNSTEVQRICRSVNTYIGHVDKTNADDDINGFVIFAKVFDEIDSADQLTPEIAGEVILKYVAESRGMLWWNYGHGNRAFSQLMEGCSPRESGSRKRIGSGADGVTGQIFYDSIGLIFAGRPEAAAQCAKIVSGVMDGGEGMIGGMFICACISAAFIYSDIRQVVETALSLIPKESEYAEMVRYVTALYDSEPKNYNKALHYIEDKYREYYACDCGARVVLALLYGEGNFDYTMELCLFAGHDTDCNCGNAGSIVGALAGTEHINYENWIRKFNDVIYCSSAVPCENEVDITRYTAKLMLLYAKFNNCEVPEYIRKAADENSYVFAFPYSYHGFEYNLWIDDLLAPQSRISPHKRSMLVVPSDKYVTSPTGSPYMLKVWADKVRGKNNKFFYKISRWFNTGDFHSSKYEPSSCTSIYPGQTVTVTFMTRFNDCRMRVFLSADSTSDKPKYSDCCYPEENEWNTLTWKLPDIKGYYTYLSICIEPEGDSDVDRVYDGLDLYIDSIHISGQPVYKVDYSKISNYLKNHSKYPLLRNFTVPYGEVKQPDSTCIHLYSGYPEHTLTSPQRQRVCERKRYSLAFTGTYLKESSFSADISIPEYGTSALLVFASKGITEHYAAGIMGDKAVIARTKGLPGEYEVLASTPFDYIQNMKYTFSVSTKGGHTQFAVYDNISSPVYLQYNTTEELTGCAGFAAFGGGINIYKYYVNTY